MPAVSRFVGQVAGSVAQSAVRRATRTGMVGATDSVTVHAADLGVEQVAVGVAQSAISWMVP